MLQLCMQSRGGVGCSGRQCTATLLALPAMHFASHSSRFLCVFEGNACQLQAEVQEAVAHELDAIADKHPDDGLLQLQLAASKLDLLLAEASYDHAQVLAAANLPHESAKRPWQDVAPPVRECISECGLCSFTSLFACEQVLL